MSVALKKGKYRMRDGRQVTIYGPAHHYENRFAGHIEGQQTTHNWHPNGIWHVDGVTETDHDLVGVWVK